MMTDDISKKDWSTAFKRLRTEVVILSLFLAAITRLPIDLRRLPSVFLQLDSGEPPRGAIVLIAVVFFVYFLGAWLLRYRVERSEALAPDEQIRAFLGDISDKMAKVAAFNVPDGSSVLREAERAEENLRGYQASFRADLESCLRKGELISSRLNKVVATDTPERKERLLQTADERLSELSGMISNLQRWPEAGIAGLEKTVQSIANERTLIASDIETKGPAIEEAIERLTGELDKLKHRLQNKKKVIFWEREAFAFWAPLGFVIVMVPIWVPQSMLDIRPAADNLIRCAVSPDDSCFYRDAEERSQPILRKVFRDRRH